MRRAGSFLLTVVFIFTQILFAHRAEASVWDERRAAASRSLQLARATAPGFALPAVNAVLNWDNENSVVRDTTRAIMERWDIDRLRAYAKK